MTEEPITTAGTPTDGSARERVLVEAETSSGSRDLYIVLLPDKVWGSLCTFKVLHLGVDACSHGNSHDDDDDNDG